MRFFLAILFFALACHGADDCQEMYDGFKSGLDVQLTSLCETTEEGVYSFRFFLEDDKGFHDMNLVFTEEHFHLYIETDENPYVCDEETALYRTQTPEEILKMLFIPARKYCSREFRKSIGIN